MRAADHAKILRRAVDLLYEEAKSAAQIHRIEESANYTAMARGLRLIAQAYREEAERNPE